VIVTEITGPGIPLRGNDIDTDRIVPARFLKCVTFDGIGEHAFTDDIKGLAAKGETHPFADARFANAAVLVANQNFGCGSSREHAPQSLQRWGIRAIIAESYSEIFYGNCVSLAIPCFTADHETCAQLQAAIESNPEGELTLDIAAATATGHATTAPVRAGAASGLIRSIEPASYILREIISQAEDVLRNRPQKLLGG